MTPTEGTAKRSMEEQNLTRSLENAGGTRRNLKLTGTRSSFDLGQKGERGRKGIASAPKLYAMHEHTSVRVSKRHKPTKEIAGEVQKR